MDGPHPQATQLCERESLRRKAGFLQVLSPPSPLFRQAARNCPCKGVVAVTATGPLLLSSLPPTLHSGPVPLYFLPWVTGPGLPLSQGVNHSNSVQWHVWCIFIRLLNLDILVL